MIDKKITVTELSKKIGVASSNLSRKLQNSQEDYKLSYLCQVLSALGASAEIVIKDSESGQTLYTIKED